tara:strand:+ start:562 stop:777 length:216 start_codon:yes stop_codon:yes gene_type:complete
MKNIKEILQLMPGRGRRLKNNEKYEMLINPGKSAAEEWLLYNDREPPKELKKKWCLLNFKFMTENNLKLNN